MYKTRTAGVWLRRIYGNHHERFAASTHLAVRLEKPTPNTMLQYQSIKGETRKL